MPPSSLYLWDSCFPFRASLYLVWGVGLARVKAARTVRDFGVT